MLVIIVEWCRLFTEGVCDCAASCNRSTITEISLISAETLQLEIDHSTSQQLCDIWWVLSRQTSWVLLFSPPASSYSWGLLFFTVQICCSLLLLLLFLLLLGHIACTTYTNGGLLLLTE